MRVIGVKEMKMAILELDFGCCYELLESMAEALDFGHCPESLDHMLLLGHHSHHHAAMLQLSAS